VFNPGKTRRELEEARRRHGGRDWPASFDDRLTAPVPSWRDVLRMIRVRRPTAADRRAAGVELSVVGDRTLPRAAAGRTLVTWVGHASFVIQTGGLTVLTDPVWSSRIPGWITRFTPPGIAWESLPRIDAVLISHNHYDHLDLPTITRLPRDTPMLVPGNLGWWFRRRGFRDITDFDWWESRRIGDVAFDFVPAHHWSRRTPYDTNQSLWGGWVLTPAGGPRTYFAGDSGYGDWFREIGARYRGIDLALLPVGAYEPSWFMRPQHMNPEEAVRAAADVGARRMATMHWGTFVLSTEPLLEPRARSVGAWAAAGRDRADLWDLGIGQTRGL
jgi:L-ascorbate metabolism protein UlaG (beta-lactamase superfamily)